MITFGEDKNVKYFDKAKTLRFHLGLSCSWLHDLVRCLRHFKPLANDSTIQDGGCKQCDCMESRKMCVFYYLYYHFLLCEF